MKGIQIEDIRALRFPSSLAVSPNGMMCAYTVQQSNEKGDGYDGWLYILDTLTNSTRRMTFRGEEKGCLWDDDETLLFAAVRGKDDESKAWQPQTTFYRLSVRGGEACKAFTIPRNVGQIVKAGKGCYVVQAVTDRNMPASEEEAAEEKDYHVLDEIPLWGNGRGYISGKRSALFLFNESDGEAKQITPANADVRSFDVKDGKVVWTGQVFDEKLTIPGEAWLYVIETGTSMPIIAPGTYSVGDVAFAGADVVLALSDMQPWGSGQNPDLYRWNEKDGLRMVARPECVIGGGVMTDSMYGGVTRFLAKGDTVYFAGLVCHRQNLYMFGADNIVRKAFDFDGSVLDFAKTASGYAFVANSRTRPVEVYLWKDNAVERVTDENGALVSEREIVVPEPCFFTDSDGVAIEGWVLKPVGFDPEKRYPGVLEIHGGPRGTYGDVFFHEMQSLCAKGMFVFFCNPRGGEGYGEAFADLRGKYGDVDYRDLMEFTDHVLAAYPQLDSERLGAAGGSYGGFMCNWIEGHTDRFAAIASQRSIANWISDFVSSEIGVTFDQNEMTATPWTDVLKLWEHSPLKYADKAKTPILFIHSMCDYNCPFDQGVEMFTAMKYFGVPSKMVLFEGENHSLSRSGKPKHRERRLREISGWFEKYLKPEA